MGIPGKFILADSKIYPLKGTYRRWMHLATIHYGVREFIYILDTHEGKTYIEEITGGGGPYRINDNSLWYALANFLSENEITVAARREE